MCELCDQSEDGIVACQFCSCVVCFDLEHGDDFIRPAVVTESGDLACDICARRIAKEEAENMDEAVYWPDPEDVQ